MHSIKYSYFYIKYSFYFLIIFFNLAYYKLSKCLLMYGNKIRIIRLCRGLSQEDVAKKLGIIQNAYSKIENNHTKLSEGLLQQLADIFGVSIADIKSPEPIIISFHNTGNVNGEGNRHVNEKLVQELSNQLLEKDKQIQQLIGLLNKK